MVATSKRKLRFTTGSAKLGHHEALWAEPYTLWPGVPSRLGGPGHARPALVSYSGDDFMDRMRLDVLSPAKLRGVERTGTTAEPAKFFLPFHGHFALMATSLVCVVPGHPDRAIDDDKKESAWFVVRRVRTTSKKSVVEEAWVPGENGGWVYAGTPSNPRPVDDEERLRLVPMTGLNDRTIRVGYIPLASTETYKVLEDDDLSAVAEFQKDWKDIDEELRKIQTLDGRQRSAQIILELDTIIRRWMPGTNARLEHRTQATAIAQAKFANWLEDPAKFHPLNGTWADALRAVRAKEGEIGPLRTPSAFDSSTMQMTAAPRPDTAAPVDFDLGRISSALLGELYEQLEAVWGDAQYVDFPDINPTLDLLALGVKLAAAKEKRRDAITSAFLAMGSALSTLKGERYGRSVAWLQRLIGDRKGYEVANPLEERHGHVGFIGNYLPDVALALRAKGLPGVDADNPAKVGEKAPGAAFWTSLQQRLGDEGLTLKQALIDVAEMETVTIGGDGHYAPKLAWSAYDVTTLPRSSFEKPIADVKTQLAGAVLPKYPVSATDEGVHFVVRCVLEHACRLPERQLFSNASDPWYPAPLFDPEAPARQIRVPMPMNLSAAKLAKPAGLGFVMSKEMRKLMASIGPKTLKGELGSAPNVNLGAICTFSIPIVTICALILLLIMVYILNFIFQWLPYFIVCLPLKLFQKPAAGGGGA